jgi:hypothetical protein
MPVTKKGRGRSAGLVGVWAAFAAAVAAVFTRPTGAEASSDVESARDALDRAHDLHPAIRDAQASMRFGDQVPSEAALQTTQAGLTQQEAFTQVNILIADAIDECNCK